MNFKLSKKSVELPSFKKYLESLFNVTNSNRDRKIWNNCDCQWRAFTLPYLNDQKLLLENEMVKCPHNYNLLHCRSRCDFDCSIPHNYDSINHILNELRK